ncbi:lactate racemase domain-containing protein [Candidatus Latescibacterota bacterium]
MIVGAGYTDRTLSETEVDDLCAEGLSRENLDGKTVLVILPDYTRSGPIDMMFRVVYRQLAGVTAKLDFLIALGTHPPMTDDQIYTLVGITPDEHRSTYSKARFFNHKGKDPDQLTHAGSFSEDDIAEISGGLFHKQVDVNVNKMLFEYDHVMIIGATFPHESMGFSGGYKYFFPGVCGEEIIDTFHWIGALLTVPVIIGVKDTPMRRLINRAAEFIPTERTCISLVVKGRDLHGMYIGHPLEAFSAAADLSDKIHITYMDRPYKRVLSCAPPMYDEIWTAGKCMYKLESVVADGGELIIYAPDIDHLSVTYGDELEQVGYHIRDYFAKQWDRFKDYTGNTLAHSCNVRGIGTFEDGVEKPRIDVILATKMSEEYCKSISLGYCDPATIDVNEWKEREDEGLLYVPHAGEMLYLLKDNPFR